MQQFRQAARFFNDDVTRPIASPIASRIADKQLEELESILNEILEFANHIRPVRNVGKGSIAELEEIMNEIVRFANHVSPRRL